jgi:NAD+ synthase
MTHKITDPLALELAVELKKFSESTGLTKAVVGLSGGVDSAVTLAIGVAAFGAANVTGLILPQAEVSSSTSAELAAKVAEQFKIKTETVEIGAALHELRAAFGWQGSEVADQNIAPRLRMTVLYHFARTHDALVLGTSNKSEILLGYGTKWGDFAADVEVIGALYKTEVYALAKGLEIPAEIIARPPTAELAHGVTDESELGASYEKLDAILQDLVAADFSLLPDTDPSSPELRRTGEFTQKILTRIKANQHKTELPPVLQVES